MPDGCGKVQYELLKAGRDNSTLMGQSRTVHSKTEHKLEDATNRTMAAKIIERMWGFGQQKLIGA
jgi:hypothetical protein